MRMSLDQDEPSPTQEFRINLAIPARSVLSEIMR